MGVSNQRFGATRTLVVFPGALGDFVCFAGALAAITRRDGVPPAILLKDSLAPLLRGLGLGAPLPLEGPAGAWLFSDSPPREAEALFGAYAAIECFSGHAVGEVHANVARWAGTRGRVHPFRPARPVHLAAHFLACLEGDAPGVPECFWTVPAALVRRGTLLVPGESNESPPVIVQPGSGAPRKRWSREGFRRIAARLRAEGRRVVVVLGPAERGEAQSWREAGFAVVDDPPLEPLAGLLAASAACLGNDSGTSHLAAVVGASGVAVFGPTDERRWRPCSSRWETVRPTRWSAVDEAPDAEAVETILCALRARLTG